MRWWKVSVPRWAETSWGDRVPVLVEAALLATPRFPGQDDKALQRCEDASSWCVNIQAAVSISIRTLKSERFMGNSFISRGKKEAECTALAGPAARRASFRRSCFRRLLRSNAHHFFWCSSRSGICHLLITIPKPKVLRCLRGEFSSWKPSLETMLFVLFPVKNVVTV